MTPLFWLGVLATLIGSHLLAYFWGRDDGHADARDAYLEALDWLAEQHKANDRRMCGE